MARTRTKNVPDPNRRAKVAHLESGNPRQAARFVSIEGELVEYDERTAYVKRVRIERVTLTENPNRAPHTAPATGRSGHETAQERRTRIESRRDYRPLTVSTPIKRARIEPRTTSYTV